MLNCTIIEVQRNPYVNTKVILQNLRFQFQLIHNVLFTFERSFFSKNAIQQI